LKSACTCKLKISGHGVLNKKTKVNLAPQLTAWRSS